MKKTIFAFAAAALLMCSCATSQSSLSDLRQLSDKINTEGATYGVKDWEYTAYKYYKVDKKIAKYTAKGAYTDSELEEIGQLQASCTTGFAKGVKDNVTGKVQSAASILKGFVNGVKDAVKE